MLFSVSLNKYYIGQSGDNITERLKKYNSDHSSTNTGRI
ncbi:MAG: hypothetical protein ACXVNO_08830 [Bacteroidia bacterium]